MTTSQMIILLYCFPSHPSDLWDQFKEHICDDLHYHLQHQRGIQNPTEHQVYDFGLFLIDKIIYHAGKSLKDLQDMPHFTGDWEDIRGNHLVAEQLDYIQTTELEACIVRYIKYLNTYRGGGLLCVALTAMLTFIIYYIMWVHMGVAPLYSCLWEPLGGSQQSFWSNSRAA